MPTDGPTEAEPLARLALTAAVLGGGFPVLLPYAAVLLARYAREARDEAPSTRRKARWAAVLLAVFSVPWGILVVAVALGG